MVEQLSILIPTYNNRCIELVRRLSDVANATGNLEYEIVVADDGSDKADIVKENEAVASIPNCRYIRNRVNKGRAFTRNFLAQSAQYEWLLFIDCEVEIPDDNFLSAYINAANGFDVVYGGVIIGGNAEALSGNLRYNYEKACEPHHCATNRNKHPYANFRTANFLIRQQTILRLPFNENVKSYGYEDVMYGKCLCDNHVKVLHIDNGVEYVSYESNLRFLKKTEEAMHTLLLFKKEMEKYSRLIHIENIIDKWHLRKLFHIVYKVKKESWRKQLLSSNPSTFVFNLYKLGYFIDLSEQQHNRT